MNAATPNLAPGLAGRLADAAGRLASKGLLQAGDTVSVRLPGEEALLRHTMGSAEAPLRVAFSPTQHMLADGDPLLRHLRLYAARPDVGAVVISRQPWATALRWTGEAMPGVFDEQVRHLGRRVEMIGQQFDQAADLRKLGSGANAFLVDDQVLCLGMTVERVVFNTELLEKCAKAFLLARCTDKPVGTIPWLVRYIANGRLRKDEARAAAEFAAGREPVMSSAY